MAKGNKEVAVSKGKLERLPRALSPFEDMERLFGDFFGRRALRPWAWERPLAEIPEFGPSVDVIDREDEVLVRAEVPGFKKEDIEVTVSGDLLTLKGETKTEEKEEKGDYYRCEISRGSFYRMVDLPAAVERCRRLLDADCDPLAVDDELSADEVLQYVAGLFSRGEAKQEARG